MNGRRRADNCYQWSSSNSNMCHLTKEDQTWLWHRKLGHISLRSIDKAIRNEAVEGIPTIDINSRFFCGDCLIGKQTKTSHKILKECSTTRVHELLHLDLMGPMQIESLGGKKYVLVVVDDYSRFTWVRFLKGKSDAVKICISLCLNLQREKGKKIIRIRSDHGKEFDNEDLNNFCQSEANREYHRKWDVKSEQGIFLGYSQNSRVYRVFNNRSGIVMETINVVVNDFESTTIQTYDEDDETLNMPVDSSTLPAEVLKADAQADGDPSTGIITRKKEKVDYSKMIADLCYTSTIEPSTVDVALKDEYWINAMQEELLQFRRNNVWTLVPKLEGANIIDKHGGRTIMFSRASNQVESEGIFISQEKYAKNIIKKFGLEQSWHKRTPAATHVKITKDTDGARADHELYRSIIGSLLYLTASRPDIAYAIGICARYQVAPRMSHLKAVKRILKYIHGINNFGILYSYDTASILVGYCDADWAGSSYDKKSTSRDMVKSSEGEPAAQISSPSVQKGRGRRFKSTPPRRPYRLPSEKSQAEVSRKLPKSVLEIVDSSYPASSDTHAPNVLETLMSDMDSDDLDDVPLARLLKKTIVPEVTVEMSVATSVSFSSFVPLPSKPNVAHASVPGDVSTAPEVRTNVHSDENELDPPNPNIHSKEVPADVDNNPIVPSASPEIPVALQPTKRKFQQNWHNITTKTGRKKIPPNIPSVPIDEISFHPEEIVQRWKFVVQRRLADELIKEFRVYLPNEFNDLSSSDHQMVHIRGFKFVISPAVINGFLGNIVDLDCSLSTPSIEILASILSGGIRSSWPVNGIPAIALSVKYVILHKIGIANWFPSSYASSVSAALGTFLYQICNDNKIDTGGVAAGDVVTVGCNVCVANRHHHKINLFLLPPSSYYPIFANLVPLHLDSTNYVLWKYQVSFILKAHFLFGHIDDSLPCPLKFLLSPAVGTTHETNLEYLQWLSLDQALITLINATLSSSALAHVVGSTSSKSLWFSLDKRYSSNNKANILDLRSALYTIKKNSSKTIEQYTYQIKALVDKLATASVSLEEEILVHTLKEESTIAKSSAIESNSTAMAAAQHFLSSHESRNGSSSITLGHSTYRANSSYGLRASGANFS
ncbi:uncharacterized protein E5676_scaffold298G00290 [Cucumis melo var. makuwa]|uniref:Integrase catalytic domain-containing protein n=1 Tax=Cucumis melo var. makuwa TaxID=1194695 RepID=A0A5D3BUR4_CUCMM|nr:uncharacterized protein E5676_scaffold298G00290 [Cucumis melo var. makuwa]